ncbi:hypothetical protein V7x_26190 [Crateriforma conspicua]|uniref:Uncharacterized protein n=1 Tax=Crateriforma conspicua TaxID=2527996 RepID=A0A5C6FVM0_9PLAN|nr:hypothetical protein V7x_26190 [Crateriforma conspicua]
MDPSEIPPGEVSLIDMVLSTEGKQKKPESGVSIALLHGSDPLGNARIDVRYQLSGMLAFVDSMSVAHIDPDASLATVEIPFYFTKPISLASLVVSAKPTFGEEAVVERGDNPELGVIKLRLNVADLPPSGLTTTVFVDDPGSGRMADSILLVRPNEIVTVSPRTLRFLPREEGGFETHTIVRIKGEEEEEDETPSKAKEGHAASIEARIGRRALRVNAKHIGADVYRVQLICSDELMSAITDSDPRPNMVVNWSILSTDLKATHSSPFKVVHSRLSGAVSP